MKLESFNEYNEKIRISCAGLARIIIDNNYLLLLNKSSLKKGEKVYTPIGGGIEFFKDVKEYLDKIVLKYERKTPDLRLFMYKYNLLEFKKWFYKRTDRELYIGREIIEELVEETNILNSLDKKDFIENYLKTIEDIEYYNNIKNYRYFEIFDVSFNEEIVNKLIKSLKKSEMLYLASKEEINKGITNTGIKIGNNCKSIL